MKFSISSKTQPYQLATTPIEIPHLSHESSFQEACQRRDNDIKGNRRRRKLIGKHATLITFDLGATQLVRLSGGKTTMPINLN